MRETLDPHFRKILEGLQDDLSPKVFEECVQDLLRDAYPGLVPIYGGQDAGMDAAIADGEGEAYPVVITTAQDVRGNLTSSLKSYKAAEGRRRRVVLATSRALTPTRRRNLETQARELGFTLVQVHEQRDLANRLYGNSHWTKALLALSGAPRALSSAPVSRRPVRQIPLVGRTADLEWMTETSGDRVIVGQPGSGKTYLAAQLVSDGKALFLTGDDWSEVANDLRDLQPPVVIVDDAHLEPTKLATLRQLRQDIGASFDVLATTWPGGEEDVIEALGGRAEVSNRLLELLTRREIIEVLRSLGLEFTDDDPHLRLLVDQSANKPGLAVTLGSLWLRGVWEDVATGGALKETLIPTLRRVLEKDPTSLLACFALGGDRGVSLEAVSSFLQEGLGEVHQQATQASQGGVLSVSRRDSGVLVVEPEPLRSALIGETFFPQSSLPALSYQALIRQTEDLGSAVETLIKAALLRVNVPRVELRELVAEAEWLQTWKLFALLGESEAEWVLENYPLGVSDVGLAALEEAPRAALRKLLPASDSAREVVRAWVQAIPDDQQEPLRRRKLLVDEAIRFLDAGGDDDVGSQALLQALSPRLEDSRPTADGTAIALRYSQLGSHLVAEVVELWERIQPRIVPLSAQSWRLLQEVLHYWIHPESAWRPEPPVDRRQQMRDFARRVLRDLTPQALEHPGLASQLTKLAEEVGIELDESLDPEFEVLFPPVSRYEAGEVAARELGRRWAADSPAVVVRKSRFFVEEADRWTLRRPGRLMDVCSALAESVDKPGVWLAAFLDGESEPLAVYSLMARVVRDRETGWELLLERCLREERYSWLAVGVTLSLPELPDQLLELAVEKADQQNVESVAHRGEMPLATMQRFLAHEDQRIVLAAVIGAWLADPQGTVREELRTEWRRAVLGVDGAEVDDAPEFSHFRFWLRGILAGDRELAHDWLVAQLQTGTRMAHWGVSWHGLDAAAVSALNEEQRASVLDRFSAETLGNRRLSMLIGSSVALYRRFLERTKGGTPSLAALAVEEPTEAWIEMVKLALGKGADPASIASEVVFPFRGEGFTTTDPAYVGRWESGLQRILDEGPAELLDVARQGLRIAAERRELANKRKRAVELHGHLG